MRNRLRTGPALIGEAIVALVGEDEMIQEGNAEQLSALPESASEDAILLAGRRIATRRVIMRTNPGGGIHEDQWFEHFARMHDGQRQGTD